VTGNGGQHDRAGPSQQPPEPPGGGMQTIDFTAADVRFEINWTYTVHLEHGPIEFKLDRIIFEDDNPDVELLVALLRWVGERSPMTAPSGTEITHRSGAGYSPTSSASYAETATRASSSTSKRKSSGRLVSASSTTDRASSKSTTNRVITTACPGICNSGTCGRSTSRRGLAERV